jgi:DtxR family Mn-dependent transcriptional regulator
VSEPILMTPSLEDYLEVILDLNEQNKSIRVTDLAEKLGVAKSSVNQAVVKLVDLKLLIHERYGPLVLTRLGEAEAQKIRERHRILKQFLSEILGVDPSVAEKDACGIEHYISPATMEKLVAYLTGLINYRCPKNCPGNMGKMKQE